MRLIFAILGFIEFGGYYNVNYKFVCKDIDNSQINFCLFLETCDLIRFPLPLKIFSKSQVSRNTQR